MIGKIIVLADIQFQLSDVLKKQIKQIALDQDVTMKFLIIDALSSKYPSLKSDAHDYLTRHVREKEYR